MILPLAVMLRYHTADVDIAGVFRGGEIVYLALMDDARRMIESPADTGVPFRTHYRIGFGYGSDHGRN